MIFYTIINFFLIKLIIKFNNSNIFFFNSYNYLLLILILNIISFPPTLIFIFKIKIFNFLSLINFSLFFLFIIIFLIIFYSLIYFLQFINFILVININKTNFSKFYFFFILNFFFFFVFRFKLYKLLGSYPIEFFLIFFKRKYLKLLTLIDSFFSLKFLYKIYNFIYFRINYSKF